MTWLNMGMKSEKKKEETQDDKGLLVRQVRKKCMQVVSPRSESLCYVYVYFQVPKKSCIVCGSIDKYISLWG